MSPANANVQCSETGYDMHPELSVYQLSIIFINVEPLGWSINDSYRENLVNFVWYYIQCWFIILVWDNYVHVTCDDLPVGLWINYCHCLHSIDVHLEFI